MTTNKELKESIKAELRAHKAKGRSLSIGLNASLEKLQEELNRLNGQSSIKKEYPPLEPPSFGEPEIIVNPDPDSVIVQILLDLEDPEVGFDIETSRSKPREGEIRLYQCYIPEQDTVLIWDRGEPECDLEPLLTVLDNPKVTKIIHNAQFEYLWVREKHGIKINNVLDTMILSQVARAGTFEAYQAAGLTSPNSLETLSKEFGFEYSKEHQGYDYDDPSGIPWAVYQYGAYDAKATYKLSKAIKRPKQDIDLLLTEVFGELSYNGFSADYDAIVDLREEYRKVWQKLETEILQDLQANPQSPKQLLTKIFERYGKTPITYDRKTRTHKPSTDKPSINDFIASNPDLDTEVLKKVQHFRSIKKIGGDYPKKYLVNYHNGKLYGNYKILGFSGEGRSSCKDENIQNVAKHTEVVKSYGLPALRSIFKAKSGRVFIEIDLAACHAQIARFLSRDENLIISRKTGIKLHFFTLQTMLAQMGIYLQPIEIKRAKADKEHEYNKLINNLYKLSKNVFYSFLNWAGGGTLQSTFSKEDVIISVDTCKEYLTATALTFSGLREFQNKLIAIVESRYKQMYTRDGRSLGLVGYLDLIDGSRMFFPQRYATPSKICASVWLRIEATGIKKALLEMQTQKINQRSPGWESAVICNFSHDSFVIEVPEEEVVRVAEQAYEILNRNITQYVHDYETEEELLIDQKTGLTRQPKKGEIFSKSDLKGYNISKEWS